MQDKTGNSRVYAAAGLLDLLRGQFKIYFLFFYFWHVGLSNQTLNLSKKNHTAFLTQEKPMPRTRAAWIEKNKIWEQEIKRIDGQIVHFYVTVPKRIRDKSMKEEQTEDMPEREEVGPYAAMSGCCRPLVTFFLSAFHWRDNAAVRAHTQTHWVAYPHICTYAHMHSDGWFARESWESRLLSPEQIVAMPHWLPCSEPRQWPRSTKRQQSIRTGLAHG